MSEQRRTISIVEAAPSKTFLQKLLDGVETVGNKVPHPAVIFYTFRAGYRALALVLPSEYICRLRGRQP